MTSSCSDTPECSMPDGTVISLHTREASAIASKNAAGIGLVLPLRCGTNTAEGCPPQHLIGHKRGGAVLQGYCTRDGIAP